MRIYFGVRLEGSCQAYVWDSNNPSRPIRLATRLDLWNHSPDGFEWGYNGSGPAQLALALAADALADDTRAMDIHQHLKRDMVCAFNKDCWSVTRATVIDAIVRLEIQQQRERRIHRGESS